MKTENKKGEMSFLGHLGALRKHLFRSLIAVAIGAGIVAFNTDFVFDHVIFAATHKNFITYRLFNEVSQYFSHSNAVDMTRPIELQSRKVFGQFNTYMWVTAIGGLILAFPYIVYELYLFILPALKSNERKYSFLLLISTTLFFTLGVLFGYYMVFPIAFQFGYYFSVSKSVMNIPDVSDYITLLLNSTLAMGAVFLFPIVIYFLTKFGIVTPKFLTDYRRQSFIGVLVLAAMVTPGDGITMLLVALPLYLLYEFSILISKLTYKKNTSLIEKN